MARNTWATAVILAGMVALAADAFAEVRSGVALVRGSTPPSERGAPLLVSLTASPPSGQQEILYTVPRGSQLLVTRACVEHTAMVIEVGEDEHRLSYGPRGCTDFVPGFVVASGESIYCDNGSGLERTCALVGIVEPLAPQVGQRVRFHDLRK